MKLVLRGLILACVMLAAQTCVGQMNDQQFAQQRVNKMAQYQLTGHLPGHRGFEGTGFHSSRIPNTCTPPRPMRLTADAMARDYRGWNYRLRIWR